MEILFGVSVYQCPSSSPPPPTPPPQNQENPLKKRGVCSPSSFQMVCHQESMEILFGMSVYQCRHHPPPPPPPPQNQENPLKKRGVCSPSSYKMVRHHESTVNTEKNGSCGDIVRGVCVCTNRPPHPRNPAQENQQNLPSRLWRKAY